MTKAIHARSIIGVFYLFVFTTSVQTFSYFYQFPDWNTLVTSRHLFEPLWPSRWMLWFNWEISVRLVLVFYFTGSLLAMIFWERWRWVRIVAFISMLQYLSLISSFGKIDHYMHIMLVVMFMLIFLSDQRAETTLKLVYGIQTFILLTYFVSGSFKFFGIVMQEISGQMSALSPEALSHHVARSILTTNNTTFFGTQILDRPSPLTTLVLLSGYLVEVSSVFIIFRPDLHRVWGLVLLVFHSAILMTIGPDFTVQMLVVGLFLVFSPFDPAVSE